MTRSAGVPLPRWMFSVKRRMRRLLRLHCLCRLYLGVRGGASPCSTGSGVVAVGRRCSSSTFFTRFISDVAGRGPRGVFVCDAATGTHDSKMSSCARRRRRSLLTVRVEKWGGEQREAALDSSSSTCPPPERNDVTSAKTLINCQKIKKGGLLSPSPKEGGRRGHFF